MNGNQSPSLSIPVLDLSQALLPSTRQFPLSQLREALFHTGFLYIINHEVDKATINDMVEKLPIIFDLPSNLKSQRSKKSSPHFLGYSGFAEETTLGKKDLREQWDFGSDVPAIWNDTNVFKHSNSSSKQYSELYWRLRGPNQWPPEERVPGFRKAYMKSVTITL